MATIKGAKFKLKTATACVKMLIYLSTYKPRHVVFLFGKVI